MKVGTVVVFDAKQGSFKFVTHSAPNPGFGEMVVRNSVVALCPSDLKTYQGIRQEPDPTVLGHEVFGYIAAFGSGVSRLDIRGSLMQVGDRVTWSVFASDPNDPESRAGRPQKAKTLFKYGHQLYKPDDKWHGGLATYSLIRTGTLISKVHSCVPDGLLASTNCAIATSAGAVRLAGKIRDLKVLIAGGGLIGLTVCAMCFEQEAASITVIDPSKKRRTIARLFGATGTESPCGHSEGYDLVIETSGMPESMEQTLKRLKTGGRAVWLGAVQPQRAVQVDAESVIRRLITIKGLHNYNNDDFRSAIEFVERAADTFPFESLFGKVFSLHETQKAFEYAGKEDIHRVLIRVGPQNLSP